jgi:L-2,4-diaminobutyrate decarboxylase
MREDMFYLAKNNLRQVKLVINKFIDMGLNFKLQKKVRQNVFHLIKEGAYEPTSIPTKGKNINTVLREFEKDYLPSCVNWSSANFMGFPDAGNSVPGIGASFLADLLQQNLANQTVCGPSATFIEIDVIQWMRSIIGYPTKQKVTNVAEAGGVVTSGGTLSNAMGIMLARENTHKDATQKGLYDKKKRYVVVPKGIGHYSVKAAQMWLGCGNYLLEVDTKDYVYNTDSLKKTLRKYKSQIMCVVAYAGDSRSQSIDNFDKIHSIVRAVDKNIWLHADACHGFALGFSEKHKHKLRGIEKFDSVSIDPHKVLDLPYNISIFLVKNPEKINSIQTISDLILKENFAFGQVTPFMGSKGWHSLKLWFLLKNMGTDGIGKIIDSRIEIAQKLSEKLNKSKKFIVLNNVGYNSVMFLYKPNKIMSVTEINKLNQQIYTHMLNEGEYYLHQFSIPDRGVIQEGEILYPLRFMSGNPNIKEKDLDDLINYIQSVGKKYAYKS